MNSTATNEPLVTADGTPLKISLNRALRQKKRQALFLTLPLLIFIFFLFLVPIVTMLVRSIANPEVSTILPKTVIALKAWDETKDVLPDEAIFKQLVEEINLGRENQTINKVGKRLNFERSGMSSIFRTTARKVRKITEPPYKEQLIKIKKQWGDINTWRLIKRESRPFSAAYYLAAVDMRFNDDSSIGQQPDERQIYKFLFYRTLWMSIAITLMTIILGYPIAYLLATLPMRHAALLMILVLLPFWTSLLVRTSAWMVLLGNEGVINDLLVWAKLVSDDSRLALINNKTGTFIAMTHILLPFMILPIYSVMKTIPPSLMRAARSMGATQFVAHRKIYFPLTLSGIGAGTILVFILAIGFYITPELVGGTSGVFISNFIAHHFFVSNNWGLAAALGTILLVVVLALYRLYDKVVGIDNMKMG